MRFDSVDEWHTYLESQFLDKQAEAPAQPDTLDDLVQAVPEVVPQEHLEPAFLEPEPTSEPGAGLESEPEELAPTLAIASAPTPLRRPEAVQQPDDPLDIGVPKLEDYLPWLTGDEQPAVTTTPQDRAIVEMELPEVAALKMEPEPEESPENAPPPTVIEATPKPPRKRPDADLEALRAPRPRWRAAQAGLDEELGEQWGVAASHLRFLASISGYEPEVAPKRERTRDQLITRLMNPELSLDETAVLLGVCPATIRRYTDKGWLSHHRTKGNQRRFRLSDVVSFLEKHRKNVSMR